MNNDGQRVHFFAVEQDVHLHHVRGAELFELIVHRRIATADRFELIKEVEHDFTQGHVVGQHDLATVVGHVELHTTLLIGQCHDRPHIVLRHVQMHGDDGFANFLHRALVGHLGRVLHQDDFAVGLDHLVDHAGCGGDQVLVKLTLQAFLHDLHVQQAQETTTETKTQGLRHLGLVVQGGVVELELFKCVAQGVVLVGFGGVQARKHLRLNFFEAWQSLLGRS